jgi:pyruvate/2-oxoglutarate dehydrogenase complex dihydrolipoamide dehydrogenase (E3) component
MNEHTVDVVVLGMGPGGEAVAGSLAEAGLVVVGVDELLVGGECPYWGCVPTKMMIRAAHLLAEARRIPGMAGAAEVTPDWAPVAQRIRDEATDDWDDRAAVERFEAQGGRFVRGSGRLVARDAVAVDGDVYRARRGVVVATGTTPAVPPIPGLADLPYWTNHQIVEAKELPASLVVLGGGAIGAELAQVMVRFGVRVTVVEALERLVPPEEPEAGELLAEVFAGEGIAVHTGAKATEVRRGGDGFEVVLNGGEVVTGEQLLVATGRR